MSKYSTQTCILSSWVSGWFPVICRHQSVGRVNNTLDINILQHSYLVQISSFKKNGKNIENELNNFEISIFLKIFVLYAVKTNRSVWWGISLGHMSEETGKEVLDMAKSCSQFPLTD